MTALRVPFVDLGRQFAAHEKALTEIFVRVGRGGGYVMGPSVERFEAAAADYCGVKYALGVANGTDALMLILRALGIGPGDEVITAPNSFIASAGAIAAVGARPAFADVGEDLNLDPGVLEAAITPGTKAIMAVHLTGRPAEMNAINEIANAHGIKVIEDAAQAIGASYHGKRVGGLGLAAGFSLHPLKNLNVMGDGGLVTTDDDGLYETIKRERNHGLIDRDTAKNWGLNSRLDALQAEIALYKLARLDGWNDRFREIAERYRKGLSGVVQTPSDQPHEQAVYHNFVIYAEDRGRLMDYLAERGVETKVHYPVLLHLQPAAADLGYRAGDFPVAERLASRTMSLPIYPELEEQEIDHVISSIRSFYGVNSVFLRTETVS